MSESKMDTIQALLNNAESMESSNPAAAKTYREKAERLMQKYRIEDAMLASRKKASGVQVDPEKRHVTFSSNQDVLGNQFYNLYIAVAQHYGCEFIGFQSGTGYLVGFPNDMDLVEMVYAGLRLNVLSAIDPKPDRTKPFDENVYILHEAGINWEKIAFLMNQSFYEGLELEGAAPMDWSPVPWETDEKGKGKKDGGRLIRAAKRWCKVIDEPYRAVQTPVTFRRSYAQGFLQVVRERLRELKRHQQDETKSVVGAELALRDRSAVVLSTFDEVKTSLGIKKQGSYHQKIVGEAYGRGRRDGSTADLGQTGVGGSKKELS